jgi:hypothetical protein
MPANVDLASYADVRAVFDQALDRGEAVRYELASPQAAARWRFRAYNFRKKTFVQDYKSVIMQIDKSDPRTVIVGFEDLGKLTTLDGETLELNLEEEHAEIKQLRKELGLDG